MKDDIASVKVKPMKTSDNVEAMTFDVSDNSITNVG
jgi:hypothetical protein